jgi:hypothetical protein
MPGRVRFLDQVPIGFYDTTNDGGGGGNPGGPTGSIQYNYSGSLSGSSNMVWDNPTNTLILNGDINANNINVSQSFTASGLIYPTADNGEESFIQTDGNGNLSLQYVKTVYEEIINGELTQLVKGTPVYVSGSQGAASIVYRADAANPAKMPVIYITADILDPGGAGKGIALGLIKGINTTGYPAGTEIYVAAGGGWTSTRPTGDKIIQVLGYVTKEGNGGQGVILNPGPANLPNIPPGRVWTGNSGSFPTPVLISSLSVATASFASTASFLNTLNQDLTFNGNLTLNGTASISNLIVNQVGYSSGSNQLGDAINDTQTLFGSVIIPTGSLTVTGSIISTAGITGSLFGTASFANRASTASFALNGGVTQLLAGPNITLSPINGLGQVTVTANLSGSTIFNTATGSYGSFYDTTIQTNPVANVPRSMSFNTTAITNGVSISGSTSPFNTYVKTQNAGVYNIQFSAQVDKTDGGTDDIVIWLRKNGIDLTDTATTLTLPTNNSKVVAAWNWFVTSAANDYYQIIWRSTDTDLRLLAEPISADHPGIPSVILTANRVDQFLSNTGSFSGSFTGQFTGSLFGTASYASTASFITPLNTNAFVQGGNSFGAQALIGTNDNQSLALETSGSTRMFISSSGNIGVGTNNPSANIHIVNSSSAAFRLQNIGGSSADFSLSAGNGRLEMVGNNASSGRITISQFAKYVGINQQTPTAAFHIVGAGATSATTSFLVQNSTPTTLFQILDNGLVGINRAPTSSLDVAGTTRLSGSFNTAISGAILTVIGSGSTQPVFTVQGSQGELFSVTDSLSGSLFSVNDISGLPILEVFSDNTTLIGNYQDPMLITTAKVVQTNSGSFTVYSLPTASYDTAFFEYSVKSGSNARAGNIMAIQSGTSVNFTETTTTDFGNTSAISFTVIVSGSNIALTGSSTTGSWTIKTIIRGI